MINKAIFNYKKDDGTITEIIVFKPIMLKEASNSLKEFENINVKYVQGWELNKIGLNSDDIKKYEEVIAEYLEIKHQTLEEYLENHGLDSKKIKQKSFKKEGILNLKII